MEIRGLRNGAIVSFIITMTILLVSGYFAKNRVAPIPQRVMANGAAVFDAATIQRGMDVFHRYGLMDHGSIWGNGTYRAMDFPADTLHRAGQAMRDFYAAPDNPRPGSYAAAGQELRDQIDARVIKEIHANRYDPASGDLPLSAAQAYAVGEIRRYWEGEFGPTGDLSVGFLPNTVPTPEQRRDVADFFFWTAWVAGTNRPGQSYSYTSNWPADVSVGNVPMPQAVLWSILSILGMFLVLGVVVYVVHRYRFFFGEGKGVALAQRLLETPLTPSQRATPKFFLVTGLLFLVQILNGGLLANYTVSPGRFYIQSLAQAYNYSWAKTWHVQLAVLWISIAWVGTAVYLAPLISRREPKGQRLLVNILFWATVAVVAGSLTGEVLSILGVRQWGSGTAWFWLGHQGWEYLEQGRIWQVLLLGGLVFWLVIVYRAMGDVMRARRQAPGESAEDAAERGHARALTIFYVLSAILVVVFFAFGLLYDRTTHPTIADFWRWFVVHIWVESIFEFFGVAVVALFLVTLGLVSARSALRVAYLTAILVFFGGIPGVAHHYFWFGGPAFWLGIGGMFSALETIPLILLVVRAWMEYRSIRQQGHQFAYKWPLYFLVASSVWNFIGAATFGFVINLPIVNYYEHGTYLTINHAHTALFGVYGMLAISLVLFAWRGLVDKAHWNDRLLKVSFWGLNGGLALMFVITLLPMGILQVWSSYADGLWYARSNAFYNSPAVKTLAWLRIIPDTIVIVVGALPLLYFLFATFRRIRRGAEPSPAEVQGSPPDAT